MTLINTAFAPGFDPADVARTYASEGHVRLFGAMAPEQAGAMARALEALDGWQLTAATDAGMVRLDMAELSQWDAERKSALTSELGRSARMGVGFSYLGRQLGQAAPVGGPQSLMDDFHRQLMAPQMVAFVQSVTGLTGLTGVTSQASRFGPGHYLTRHIDAPRGEHRRLAFVWGFTPKWHPDWGGLLQFYEPSGDPQRAFAPGFNTLDLFSVHKIHAVTYVAPFAGAFRHAVSGWYLGAG